MLFLVLPIHTDSVFWIVGRTDSVCALFYLSALVLFLAYLEQERVQTLVGFAICCLLALFSKEMALSLIGALAVLAVYKKVWRSSAALRILSVLSGVFLVYFFSRWSVLGSVLGGTPRVSILDWMLDGLKAIAKMGMTDVKWFGVVVLIATAGVLFYEIAQKKRRGAGEQGGSDLLCPLALLLIDRRVMEYRTFGKTGWQVSEIGLGGAWFYGRPEIGLKPVSHGVEVVERALALGINYIDTAPLYGRGRSEEVLGVALSGVTEPYYLATKVGYYPEPFDYTRDAVWRGLEASLKRLKRDHVHLLQVHEAEQA
ncbi:MAG: aldo/keto reductase, partial [Candidatus Latescibacteria bacterium]|nr:aldo/keto reductase [Candidatus Latescibacterota bacterium]